MWGGGPKIQINPRCANNLACQVTNVFHTQGGQVFSVGKWEKKSDVPEELQKSGVVSVFTEHTNNSNTVQLSAKYTKVRKYFL